EQVTNKSANLYITGDITYHTALRAKELGLNVLDVEHFDTEKFFIEALYNQLIKFGVPKDILIKSKKMESPYKLL
ncbi:MAG TPA: Nif3-like dinuclear metal center hexameric protein, partial [candidate division WOR-3 bacterium]|nr:Nif3-like dinuclear metal center hexameric protein [candidate division WOR-3 bacterium]